MKKYKILVVFILLGFIQKNMAQTNHFESETIFMHTNTSTFVTGESLLYKIYCLNANTLKLSEISKIAYVEIINEKGESLIRNKIALKNGIGTNEIFLNTTFNTGTYRLVAYTNWMLNNSKSKYFETNITIINPFTSNGIKLNNENLTTNNNNETEIKENIDVALNPSKKSFTKRDKVVVNIDFKSDKFKNGNYSVSVRKIDNLTTNRTNSIYYFKENNIDKFVTSNTFLPELRGELISGKIIANNENKLVSGKDIAMSFTGEPFDLKIVKTNENGAFYFNLNEDFRKSEALIQILESNLNDYQIIFDQPIKFEKSSSQDLSFSSKSIKDIEDRLVASQIVNAYKTADTSLENNKKFIPFYYKYAKDYILDNYKRFPSFKETIIEIIPELFFREKDNSYTLHLRDYVTNGESFGKPLVMVDGLLLQDVNELFDYNTNNIYKISTINKPYSYGSKIFSGVVSIITFNKEYESKSNKIKPITLERCDAEKDFTSVIYEADNDYDRIPDYRYQIAWETNLSLKNNTNSIEFYTSDISGKFEICLEGFSSNGEPLSIKKYFTVD